MAWFVSWSDRRGTLTWLAHATVNPTDKFWRFDFNGIT
jgi:hypothetical protein